MKHEFIPMPFWNLNSLLLSKHMDTGTYVVRAQEEAQTRLLSRSVEGYYVPLAVRADHEVSDIGEET